MVYHNFLYHFGLDGGRAICKCDDFIKQLLLLVSSAGELECKQKTGCKRGMESGEE